MTRPTPQRAHQSQNHDFFIHHCPKHADITGGKLLSVSHSPRSGYIQFSFSHAYTNIIIAGVFKTIHGVFHLDFTLTG